MAKHLYALFNVAPYDEFGRPALRPGHIPNRDTFVTFVTEMPYTGTPKLKDFFNENGEQIEYNMVLDWRELERTSLEYVTFLAEKATEQFGTLHVPTERNGREFGISEVPKVGDPVSYTINGDYTPCGFVERLTPSLTVITTTGLRFRRYKQTGAWVREGSKHFSLVRGHIDERNPEV
jgi:hypothetical protein